MKILENLAISELTTMRLGGPARYVIEIEQESDLPEAYRFATERQLPVYVLGGGSNIIGRDGGFDGVILVCKLKGMGLVSEDADKAEFYCAAGEELDDFVKYTSQKDYSGIESLSAIPGSAGAAPVQNVGAYGQEISQTLSLVKAYDNRKNEFIELKPEELDFGYRRSIFNHGPQVGRFFITEIRVKLTKTQLQPPFYNSLQAYIDQNQIQDYSPESIRKAVRAVRENKLPAPEEYASSGSFFKNVYLDEDKATEAKQANIPVWDGGKVPSGWLVDHAGLKGQLIHGMRVWDKAALVLVNESAKSYADLAAARTEIINCVKEKFGYTLEQEPMELGED